MSEFKIVPKIKQIDSIEEFSKAFSLSEDDLIITSSFLYIKFLKNYANGASHILYDKYATGEPTDVAVEAIYNDIKDIRYKRVIGIGGGSVLDIAKILCLEKYSPIVELFEKKYEAKKKCELILIPTTCGTGSEVTNISILSLTTRGTKFGLAVDPLYADYAVLVPELLRELPYKAFATSSIDALVHATESYTSPNASEESRVYSLKAIRMILEAYLYIKKNGADSRKDVISDLLAASNYAGIAFSNAGCAAVHAMSYPLGAKYHVMHGESNYVLFSAVYKKYMTKKSDGSIADLNEFISKILKCNTKKVYAELDSLLEAILPLKKMREYGVTESDIADFINVVETKQQRLTKNNFVVLDKDDLNDIYRSVF